MQVAILYFIAALVLFCAAILVPTFYFSALLAWCGLSVLLVALAYSLNFAKIFRKRRDGSIPWYIRWAFIPFLVGTQLYNAYQRRTDKVPAIQKVDEGLYLACRLFPSDVDTLKKFGVEAVLDVTCEFDGLDWSLYGEGFDYLNIPVLDHAVPSKSQLSRAINWLHHHKQQGRSVVVHCALGRGRSVMVVAAYLLTQYPELTLDDIHQKIKDARATANLNNRQFKVLKRRFENGEVRLVTDAWLIANPVSGTKKWQVHKQEIIDSLAPYYNLTVCETTPDKTAASYAQEAAEQNVQLLIACGGDGTVTEVADVCVKANITLAIIPFGTANALTHALCGLKAKLMPVTVALDAIIEGDISTIDVARCNGDLVLLLTGLGFERQMIENAHRDAKNQSGQLAYIDAFLEALGSDDTMTLTVRFDDAEAKSITTSSLTVANAAPFSTLLAQGNGEPDFQDGKLDITWLRDNHEVPNSLSVAELAMSALTQTKAASYIQHTRCERVRIESEDTLKYVIDGELFEAKALEISVEPSALRVCVPAQIDT